MKKHIILAFTAATLFFASCKKDKAAKSDPLTATRLLTKLTKKENNTTTVYNFLYDGSKRLSSYKSTDGKVGITFTYDGNGNVVKIEDKEDDFRNIYTYTYNNAVPVAADFKSWQLTAGVPDDLMEDDHLVYTVVNNQVTRIHVSFTLSQDDADFDLTYGVNGNLQKVTGGNTGYTAIFTYGTRNPVFPVVSKYILDQAGFSLQFAAKNELQTIAFDFPGSQFDKTITNQYTYDAGGYVLTANDGKAQVTYEYQ